MSELFAPKGSKSKGRAATATHSYKKVKQTLFQRPGRVLTPIKRTPQRGPKAYDEVPGYREWLQYRVAQMAQFRNKLGFPDWKRTGTPPGMNKTEVARMWTLAQGKAKKDMAVLEKAGLLPDDEIAREATEATLKVMRATKVDPKTRLAAAGQLLAYYKVKPVTKTETKLDAAEAFLAAIAKDENPE
jgi:hypothetical protein